MKNHYELNDEVFEKEFSECKMAEAIFNHEAHLRLAWIYIHKYGCRKAEIKVNEELVRYTKFLGAEQIYNKTVTTMAVRIVDRFAKKQEGITFKELLVANPELMDNFKGLIDQYYSVDVFKSSVAKAHFLEPDLMRV